MDNVWLSLFLATTVLSIVDFSDGKCSMNSPCPLKGGMPFRQPQQYVSNNGVLNITLNVEVTDFVVDWLQLRRRSYNSQIPGPTWRIKPGDIIYLRLKNTLTENNLPNKPLKKLVNTLHSPNTTNMHTHGLHVSNLNPHDDVFMKIDPLSHFDYNYPVISNHPTGTFWYHAHCHGAVWFQVSSGMGGLLVIEDPTDSSVPQHIQQVSCPLNCAHDIQMVFQSTLIYARGGGFATLQIAMQDNLFRLMDINIFNSSETLYDWMTNTSNNISYFTTNGLLNPVMDLSTGQTKRFRMLNAGTFDNLALNVVDSSGNSACDILEIAVDGIYLDYCRPPRLGRSFLAAGSRMDWLIVCNNPGEYNLQSSRKDMDVWSTADTVPHNQVLVTLKVTGSPQQTKLRTELPARPAFVGNFLNKTEQDVQRRFVLEGNPYYGVNREKFRDGTYYRYKVEVNTLQEWYLINTSPLYSHPMHIHVYSYQVISYNKYVGPYGAVADGIEYMKLWNQKNETCRFQYNHYDPELYIPRPTNWDRFLGHDIRWKKGGPETIGYSDVGVFRDVLLVPPLANITIRFLTDTFIGPMTIHCHILNHEDLGMMMVADVVAKGESLTSGVTVASGDAYPGACDCYKPFPFNSGSKLHEITRLHSILIPIVFAIFTLNQI